MAIPLRPTLLALTLLILLPATAAQAQKDFKLDDSDTWKLVGQPDPNSPAGALARARELLAEGQADKTYNMVQRWMERNSGSPLIADAYLLRADALVAMRDYYESLYDYEYIIRKYPASPTFILALARELEIASLFAHGTRRKVFGLRIGRGYDEAEEIFIRVQERAPGSQLAEQAGIELADMYFRQKRMELAADMYAIFIEKYPKSPFRDKAQRRLIYANIAGFKGPQFDIVGLREAKRELQDLIATRPAEAARIGSQALINRIIESEATKILTTARWYNRVGDPIAAEYLIRQLVKRFPRSAATVHALTFVNTLLPQLPEIILKQVPDYALLRTTLVDHNRKALADIPARTPDEDDPVPLPHLPGGKITSMTAPGESTEEASEEAREERTDERRRASSPSELLPGEPTPPTAGDDP